jgi:hypothetical protein
MEVILWTRPMSVEEMRKGRETRKHKQVIVPGNTRVLEIPVSQRFLLYHIRLFLLYSYLKASMLTLSQFLEFDIDFPSPF